MFVNQTQVEAELGTFCCNASQMVSSYEKTLNKLIFIYLLICYNICLSPLFDKKKKSNKVINIWQNNAFRVTIISVGKF